jgi:hypothetical protein
MVAAVLYSAAPLPSRAAAAAGGQISDELVTWISVSPAYSISGTVVATAVDLKCDQKSRTCTHLWVTRDGGNSWRRATSPQVGSRPDVAVDGTGHEVIYAQGDRVMRSLDLGESWMAVGMPGAPAIAPTYAKDSKVVVAGQPDYILQGDAAIPISGSSSGLSDQQFGFAPSFPGAGQFSPAWVVSADRNKLPFVSRCSGELKCSGAVPLPGAGASFLSFPATVLAAPDYSSTGELFIQTPRGILRSTDGGLSFVRLTIVSDNAEAAATPMLAMLSRPTSPPTRTLYTALFEVFQSKDPKATKPHSAGGIYASADDGRSWTRYGGASDLDQGASAVAVAPDGRVFAGSVPSPSGRAGMHCADAGLRWHSTCPPVRRVAAWVVASSPNTPACTGCPMGAQPIAASTAVAGASAKPSILENTPIGVGARGSGAQPQGSAGGALAVVLGVSVVVVVAASGLILHLMRGRRRNRN